MNRQGKRTASKQFSKDLKSKKFQKDMKDTKALKTSKSFPKNWKDEKYADKVSNEQKTNNPKWYMSNPALVEGVASIPFNIPMGDANILTPDVVNLSVAPQTGYGSVHYFPGVMVVEICPSFGTQADPSSPLNIAAQAIYTWVRYYNTGTRVYTPADLLIYLLAHGQIYSMINWAMRIYGTIKQFDHRNKYMSQYLLSMMRVDYSDFVGRLAEYRGRLNLLIEKAASFVVPATMEYFPRIASIYTDIYVDGDSIKDQFYMYNPVGFYKFKFDTSATPVHDGAFLEFDPIIPATQPVTYKLTVDDVINYIDDAISRVFYAADQGVISGDLYKAYSGNIITLGTLAEEYITNIVHDDWVLNQMKNGVPVDVWNTEDLYQSNHTFNGFVSYSNHISSTATHGIGREIKFRSLVGPRIITVKDANPTVDHVMEFTRLMTQVQNLTYDTSTGKVEFDYVTGDNVIIRNRIGVFFDNAGTRAFQVIEETGYSLQGAQANSAGYVDFDRHLTMRRMFPYAPMELIVYGAGNVAAVVGLSNDIDNYAQIDSETLKHIHDVALMNLFATDAVAKLK